MGKVLLPDRITAFHKAIKVLIHNCTKTYRKTILCPHGVSSLASNIVLSVGLILLITFSV